MQRQTFVLTQKKWFRWTVRLFLKTMNNKVDQRNIKFTTEHKVSEKERNRNARTVAAEFSTADEVLIDALYRDPGYGKTFVHVDDPKGERKKEPFNITPLDAKKVALKNLFGAANLEFDGSKSTEVLSEEYSIHVAAKTGVKIAKSTAPEVPHQERDVYADMQASANNARAAYEEKYGEPVPSEFANDLAFLTALSDPNWDAKAYIASKTNDTADEVEDDVAKGELPDSLDELRDIYQKELGKGVPNPKKNEPAWIKEKILENRS